MSESIASTRYSSTVSLPFGSKMKAVRAVETFVLKAPDDALLRNRLVENRVNAQVPLFGAARRQRPGRTHKRLRGERPNLIA